MTSDVGAQLRKGVVEYCVLGLVQSGPSYGWKISEELVQRKLIGSIGTLYPVLARLRQQGLIVARTEESTGRPRKYYSLTAEGHEQLRRFREQWLPFAAAVDAIVAVGARSDADAPPSPLQEGEDT